MDPALYLDVSKIADANRDARRGVRIHSKSPQKPPSAFSDGHESHRCRHHAKPPPRAGLLRDVLHGRRSQFAVVPADEDAERGAGAERGDHAVDQRHQRAVRSSASCDLPAALRHRRDSHSSDEVVGGRNFEFELVRTAYDGPRMTWSPRRRRRDAAPPRRRLHDHTRVHAAVS